MGPLDLTIVAWMADKSACLIRLLWHQWSINRPRDYQPNGSPIYVDGRSLRLSTTKENSATVKLFSINANPFNSSEYCVGGRDHIVRYREIYDF